MSEINKKEPYVIELYNKGNKIKEISTLTSLSINKIYKILNINKIKLNRKYKYSVNENYFSKIDSYEKAYILGFILADGHNNIKRHTLEIVLHKKDLDILEKIKINMESNNKILFTNYHNSHQAKLSIINKKISNDLLKLGIIPNKTYTAKLPIIPKKFYRPLILGIFDGDGSLCINKKQYDRGYLSITGTYEIIHGISSFLKKECNVNCHINQRYKERDNNNYNLNLCGNNVVMRVLNWLYFDSKIFLDRKHNRYLELKKIINKKNILKENKKLKIEVEILEKEKNKIDVENKIINLYLENKSIRQINEILNIDRRYISKIIKKNKLTIRDKSEYKEYRLQKINEYYKNNK